MKLKKNKIIADQNCQSDLHLRWTAARAAHYLNNFTISCISR